MNYGICMEKMEKHFNQVRGSELRNLYGKNISTRSEVVNFGIFRNLYGKMEQVVSTIKLFRPSPYVTLISVSMYHAFTNLSVTLAPPPPPPPPPLTHS